MTESAALIAARKGMAALDAYQSANLDAPLDFSGVDFGKSENAEIDFTGFEFKSEVNFRNAIFGELEESSQYRPISFKNCVFNERVFFDGATFHSNVYFTEAVFKEGSIFQNVDFNHHAEFTKAFFGGTRFIKCSCPGSVSFNEVVVSSEIRFESCNFKMPGFPNSSFGQIVCWDCTFSSGPSFKDCIFAGYVFFNSTNFGASTSFEGAAFNDHTKFEDCVFGDHASFCGSDRNGLVAHASKRSKEIPLDDAAFILERARLADPSVFNDVQFYGCRFTSHGHIRYSPFEPLNSTDSEPDSLKREQRRSVWSVIKMYLGIARFSVLVPQKRRSDDIISGAKFCNRQIKDTLRLISTTFEQPPHFDDIEPASKIDFTNTEFYFGMRSWPGLRYWSSERDLVRRFKRLRSIARENDDLDLERAVFAQQRKAEQALSWRFLWDQVFDHWTSPATRTEADARAFRRHKGGKRWGSEEEKQAHRHRLRKSVANAVRGVWQPIILTVLVTLYRVFSDFGRSVIRSTIGFAIVLFGSAFWYSGQTDPQARFDDVMTFTLMNALPVNPMVRSRMEDVVGRLFPEELFPEGIPTEVIMFSAGQTIIQGVMLFLIILALRNQFRMK
jgi:hypothetical protein